SRAAELARTEAAYVHDLERLAGFLHHADVFYGHVQELATLHRAFSMRIQYMAAQPVSAQLFDTAFNGLEEAFEVYSRFCAELARSSVARSAADISALLMRPIQRLAQYPLLFQSIAAEMYSSYKEIQKAHQPLRAINSADLAMRRSKRVLRRANEATREATNEKNRANFFARVDMAPASLGRLLTSGTVSARTMHEFTMTEAFLFETRIVLCHALRQRPSRPSRIRRTLSALQLVSSSQTKPPKRQSASSSVSSATLHNDDYFRLPEIDTVTPPAGLLQSSHISLVTLRDPPRITFTSSPDVTIKEEDEEDEEEAPLDPLMLRLSLPTDAISQVCQTNEDNGTISLALQFLAFDSADETLLVMRQLTPEDAALWVRMLKRTVPLVPVSDDDNCLLVNPGFSQAVLGKHI
ncbi:Guanine nucleotide exchange factor for Cdc42p, partial [Kickxella alabastrina]